MENLIAFLITIGVLIVVHEFGHFIVAKWCGVGVLRFAVGFGPAIFKKRIGETEYLICPIPLGGYVRMVGDMPDMITGEQETDSAVRGEVAEAAVKDDAPEIVQQMIADHSRWFLEKPLWARSAIVAAGPIVNFLFAIVAIFFSLILFGQEVPLDTPKIGTVSKHSPASDGGLLPGDLVQEIDGKPIESWSALASTIHNSGGGILSLSILRDQQTLKLTITPKLKSIALTPEDKEEKYLIGISPATSTTSVGAWDAFKASIAWTNAVTMKTLEGLWGMMSGAVSPKDLAGPVFIYQAAGEQAQRGLDASLHFMALLSVSLAVFNLLPVPVLDGGHLLFFLLEAIFGPLSMRKKEMAQAVGFFVLISLMIFAVTNDILRDRSTQDHAPVTWEAPAEKATDKTDGQ